MKASTKTFLTPLAIPLIINGLLLRDDSGVFFDIFIIGKSSI